MPVSGPLPIAAVPLVGFGSVLRAHKFAVSNEQTVTFLAAVELLGPVCFEAIHLAAYACFAPICDRREEFEALFCAHFLGDPLASSEQETGKERGPRDTSSGSDLATVETRQGDSGRAADAAELLFARRFATDGSRETRRHLRFLACRMPQRLSSRMKPVRRGRSIHLSRSLARMLRNDGDVPKPVFRERRTRARNILLLIDISGSMKDQTREYLSLAHILSREVDRIEVFTIGTRLTRITQAVGRSNELAALTAAAERVSDWDGGTRLGPGLSELTGNSRYINYARGAVVLILSDGLERGDSAPLLHAMQRLRRVAWRLSWLSPLIADPQFRPQTDALLQLLPILDDLVDGSSMRTVADFVLRLAVSAPRASAVWSQRKICR
jgi:hypothetical protein